MDCCLYNCIKCFQPMEPRFDNFAANKGFKPLGKGLFLHVCSVVEVKFSRFNLEKRKIRGKLKHTLATEFFYIVSHILESLR